MFIRIALVVAIKMAFDGNWRCVEIKPHIPSGIDVGALELGIEEFAVASKYSLNGKTMPLVFGVATRDLETSIFFSKIVESYLIKNMVRFMGEVHLSPYGLVCNIGAWYQLHPDETQELEGRRLYLGLQSMF